MDSLTGLRTGRQIRCELQTMVEDRPLALAVCLVDLDRFKHVNDSFGQDVGDEVLRQASSRVESLLTGRDFVGRDVGDEFIVVLSEPERVADIAVLAEGIRAELAEPFQIAGQAVRLTTSVGFATTASGHGRPEYLLKGASLAMFAAKDAGGDRAVSYTNDMGSTAIRKTAQREMIRHALDAGRVEVHYQPIVDAHSGLVRAVEALARCRDQAGRIMEPVNFIDSINDCRLIVELDRAVMLQAFDFAVELQAAFGHGAPWVACNVSAMTLVSPGYAEGILHEIERRGLDGSAVAIEITESSAFEADESTLEGLSKLRDAGVGIALDDFGTGYSSLAHLVRLPLTVLKIDKSFVQRIDTASPEAAIARAIASLGVSLGFTVIAEGVETESQGNAVLELDIAHLQGWHFVQALPADKTMNYITLAR